MEVLKRSGHLLFYAGLLLIAGASFLVYGAVKAELGSTVRLCVLGGLAVLTGILLLARYRWAPEAYGVLIILLVANCIRLLIERGLNTRDLLGLLAALAATTGYVAMRNELRPSRDPNEPDDQVEEGDDMKNELDDWLAEGGESTLCDRLFSIITEHYRGVDCDRIPEEERVVYLVWGALGIIGNGGFMYLHEHKLRGDPDYELTIQAFEEIGCDELREAFEMYDDDAFWAADKKIRKCLASYIIAHRERYGHLLS